MDSNRTISWVIAAVIAAQGVLVTAHAEVMVNAGGSPAPVPATNGGQSTGGSETPAAVLAPDREAERALYSWAIHLSGYSSAAPVPDVRYVPRSFLAERACPGRDECKVLGWYDDNNVVYVAEELGALETLFERSLLVHEFVHYLQHRSGHFRRHECTVFVKREREAYAVQQKFFIAYGAFPQIQAHQYACNALDITRRTGQAIAAPLVTKIRREPR